MISPAAAIVRAPVTAFIVTTPLVVVVTAAFTLSPPVVAVIKTLFAAVIVANVFCVKPVAPVRVTAPAELILAATVRVPAPPTPRLFAFRVTIPPPVVVTA